MKIALVCSHGGHLTEMMFLLPAFNGHEFFFVTYRSERTKTMSYTTHLIDNIGTNPVLYLKSLAYFYRIFRQNKPQVVISTGSEIAIPAFLSAKILGIKTIFIESWCRIESPSSTGRILYFASDLFLVQWPQLLGVYGKKAKYEGSVL